MTTTTQTPAGSVTLSLNPGISGDIQQVLNLNLNAPILGQVVKHFKGLSPIDFGDRRLEFVPRGNGCADVACAAILEGVLDGLPVLDVFGFGPTANEVLGRVDLDDYRHNVVRPRRDEQKPGPAPQGWIVLDGLGVGLPDEQPQELAKLLGCEPGDLRLVPVPMGHAEPGNPRVNIRGQSVVDVMEDTGLNRTEWTIGRLVYIPPAFGPLAVTQGAAIHGLGKAWPRTVQLRRKADGKFEVLDVLDVQALRQFGVELGAAWRRGETGSSILFGEPVVSTSGPMPEGFVDQLRALAARFGVHVR